MNSPLEMPRDKPRSLLAPLFYRSTSLARKIFGQKKVMRFFLNLTFILDRITVERVADVYGSEYFDAAHAVDLELLQRWIAPDAKVIDVACARGHWTREIATICASVTGIDRDRQLIEIARENQTANVRFIAGDIS